jgi:hypothetical protein
MTSPQDSPQVFEGTDIEVDPDELEAPQEPATTDPEQQTDGSDAMGGTGGENAGGAG